MKRLKKAISIMLVFVYILTALPLSFYENIGVIHAYAKESMTDEYEPSVKENGVQPDDFAEKEGRPNPDGIKAGEIKANGTKADGTITDGTKAFRTKADSTKTDKIKAGTITLLAEGDKGINIRDHEDAKAFIVIASTQEEEEALLVADADWIYDEVFYGIFSDDIRDSYLNLPTTGPNGSTISWESSNEVIISTSVDTIGNVDPPAFSSYMGHAPVTLTATITRGDITAERVYEVQVYPQYPTEEDRVAYCKEVILTDEYILYGNNPASIETSLYMPSEFGSYYYYDMQVGYCAISWHSSHPDVISTDGVVTRPLKEQPSVTVTLTATVSYGGASGDKTFSFVVTPIEEFPLAIYYEDFSNTDRLQFNGKSGIVNTTNRNGEAISALQFNSGTGSAGGSVFTKNKVSLGNDLSFSTAFTFRNENLTGYSDLDKSGAFTFTLQTVSDAVYAQSLDDSSIQPSLSIGFVTSRYYGGGAGQEGYNYVDISTKAFYNGDYKNGTEISRIGSTRADIPFDDYTVWIEYDGTAQALEVWYATSDERPSMYYMHFRAENVDLGEILTGVARGLSVDDVREVYAGFMGSIGDAQENIAIYDWSFKNDSAPIDRKIYEFYDVSNVTLSAAPSGEVLHSTLTANVSGAGGPMAGIPVEFSTDIGSLNQYIAFTDGSGNASVTLSAEHTGVAHVKAIAKGGAMDETEAQLAATDEDSVSFDINWLINGAGKEMFLNGNSALNNVSTILNLPLKGPNGSTISWSSDNIHVNAANGAVTLPTPAGGDQQVTLTVTLSKGTDTETVTINVTVRVSDASTVSADSLWLNDERILNENSDWGNVTDNLSLPTTGQYGSTISWTSANQSMIAINGTVTKPSYTQGDQTLELTAKINKGSASIIKKYTVTVKALNPTEQEAISIDYNWLTWDIIRNGNSDPNNIIIDIYLPLKGPKDSTISWTSSNTGFISNNGEVTQPAFSQGKKKIIITAKISKGNESSDKSFELTVKTLPQTDAEAVAADIKWLDISRTLGQNMSEFSIKDSLVLLNSAPNGSAISWSSNTPQFISDSGEVERPEYTEGHKAVTLIAVFSKGSTEESKTFTYTVMAHPDTTPPSIISILATEDGTRLKSYDAPFDNPELPWNTTRFYVNFDEELEYQYFSGKYIAIAGPDAPSFWARTWHDEIIFDLMSPLKPGASYELVIPSVCLSDKYGNPLMEDVKIPVCVEQKPVRTIEVVSSTPMNSEKNVDLNLSQISIKYNYSDIVMGSYKNYPKLQDNYGREVDMIGTGLTDGTITFNLKKPLDQGLVYRLIIPAGFVKDRYTNQNKAQTIQFITKRWINFLEIASVYPQEGQADIDIHQSIDVGFTEPVQFYYIMLWLKDEAGNNVPLRERSSLYGDRNKLNLVPFQPLKPNTVYTLYGPHFSVFNPSQLQFELSFKTGENKLGIKQISPADGARGVAVHKAVEIEFSGQLAKGPAFSDIKFLDSKGNPVSFHGEESGNKAIFTPNAEFYEDEVYFIHIPKGAYKGEGDITNDDYKYCFITDKKLEPVSSLLTVPDKGLTGKTVRLNADRIESFFKFENHGIISYDWDFADGSFSSEKNPEHIFNKPGNYLVKLKVNDNKGFSYEFEKEINILPLQDVKMTVSRDGRNNLYITSAWPIPTLTYNIRLECEKIPLTGETVGVSLYKHGVLQKEYEKITSDAKNAYTFTFTPESDHLGNYELVFTYTNPSETITVREPVIITRNGSFSFLRVQLYDTRNGEIYSEAEYLNVKVDGVKKVAVREWIASLNEYVYTVKEQFPILRYYKFQLEGFSESGASGVGVLYNVGNLGDFQTRPPVKTGSKARIGIDKLVDYDVLKRYYIEGVDVGSASFAVEGSWDSLEPGYYELKSSSGRLHMTSGTGKFEWRPGNVLRVGDNLMVRMVSKNGISSNWWYYPVEVLPKPTLLGRDVSVRYVDGTYELSLATPFNEITGGSIPLLDGVPFLDGSGFGIGSDMPAFTGIIYKQVDTPKAEMDFSGEANYMYKEKTSAPFKGKKSIKKVKAVGIEVEIEVEGVVIISYDRNSKEWKTEYLVIDVDGYGGKFWSTGYKIAGVIGIEGKLELGAYVGGTLIIDRQEGRDREYSGIIRFSPGVEASVTGSYGLGEVVGSVSAFIPAEVHIPTGYIEANVDINAMVTASFLTYSTTLYDKQLFSAHWDNKKEKVVRRMLGFMPLDPEAEQVAESSGLKLTDRNYLSRGSVWLGGNESTKLMFRAGTRASTGGIFMLAGTKPEPQTDVLMENIYPRADVQLVQSGDELWLIWIDDNPDRDAVNRTQLRYRILKDGTWSDPAWFDEDGTADFSPAAASVSNGTLMAWQNISKEISQEEGLSAMLDNSEISVTAGVYNSDSTPLIVSLTNDNKLDHSPRLATDGDNALLVWTKSEGLGFTLGEDMAELKAPENSDSLYFSTWDGSGWSAPEEIQGSLPSVLDSHLTMHQDQGLLLYTLDMDNDMSTSEDREVFARLLNGSTWEDAIRLSTNELNDLNPKAAYVDGKWFITWVQDGKVIYREGLNGENKALQLIENVPNDYQLTVKEGAEPQVALVYKKSGGNKAQSLCASFYDVDKGVWSGEITLSEDVGFIHNFKPLFTDDGKLAVAYSQAEIITEIVPVKIDGEEQLVEQQNVSDKVDLKMLTYIPGHDLKFDEEEGLQLSTGMPMPDTVATVFATVLNQGDFAEKAVVELYDGNPASGGKFIASSDELIIAACSSVDVEIEWLVPSEEREEYNLYAVVRPLESITEKDESNNTINLNIKTANVGITDLICENPAKDDYILSAVIINDGSKVLNDIEIRLTHVESGEILKSESIKQLDPGQEFPINFLFPASGLQKDVAGKINMVLEAVVPEDIDEQSTEDNEWEFALEPAPILVISTTPGLDEEKVVVDTAVTLSFNMTVNEGTGFDAIILEDEDLNEVEVNKTLDGDILTVTPLSPLENHTRYTLTLPVNALGDDYGHVIDELYTMSFTTTSGNPEVSFSYPGNGMEETTLDTDIRLKFNQNVSEGPTYMDIRLIGPNDTKIPISVFIQGEWLVVKPKGNLSSDTTYSLIVPGGAVENDDKALQEDYELEFSTVSSDGSSDDNGNDPNDEDDSDNGKDKGDSKGESDQTKSYYANIDATGGSQDAQVPITVNSQTGQASVDLREMAEEIFGRDENTVIGVPSIPGVNTYTLEMLAATLSGGSGKASLTFETPVGSVKIKPGMLSGMSGLEGKTVGISIAAGDKTKLSDEIRKTLGDRPLVELTLTLDGKPVDWNNPAVPVTVTIPYIPTAEELLNQESIIVWYVDGSGRVVSVPNGHYDPISGTVTFITTHFSYYAVVYNPVSFKDVAAGEWYKKAVDFIAARKITLGTGNGNFSPKAMITRGEFITLLMRAYEIAPDENPADNFSDGGNTYYTGYLAAAKRLGISQGVGNNLFAPGNEITRQEVFTMLYNALRVIDRLPQGSSGKTLTNFTDADEISIWAKEAITLLVETGTIVGNNEKLSPGDKATRAEMAQVMYNLLSK